MRTTLLNFLLLTTVYASAQTLPQTFKMEDAPRYSKLPVMAMTVRKHLQKGAKNLSIFPYGYRMGTTLSPLV